MKVIGITGHACTGKTSLLKSIKKIPVIFTDQIVNSLYKKKSVQKELDKKIGSYTKKGVLQAIKEEPKKIFLVEKIIQPKTKKILKNRIGKLKKKNRKMVLVEVPLLFEANWEKMFDKTILVTANKKVLSQRIQNKKIPRVLLDRRIKQSVLKKKAGFIINTGKNFGKTKKEFLKILELIEHG